MIDTELEELRATLHGSLIEFIEYFFPIITGREFIISQPIGRESHQITISRELTKAFRLQLPEQRLIINVPPGSGKSVMVSMWIAWSLSQYPDSNFLYISYSKTLATKHTAFIKSIVSCKQYKYLFDVSLKDDSRAKDLFRTAQGGSVGAFGAAGSITGQDAGLPNLDRFSGAIIIDDPHKPDDVHSDTIRQSVIDNYRETIQQRARGINVPYIFIGQRLHEDDLAQYLIDDNDGKQWEKVIIQSIDIAGNSFYPEVYPKEDLLIKQERDPYVYSSQFQQDPIPAGGAIFKPEWFVHMDFEPKYIKTFITADTAETSKSWNDATVFSFWGLYELEVAGRKTGQLALHWIDCMEVRVEPKDLKDAFMDFYADCSRHTNPPMLAAIEKKSTGVTLVSILSELRGITIRQIERSRASGSKTDRFLEAQPYVASKLISFTKNASHAELCINHMSKITANDTHRHDDIADTLSDAIRIGLIEKVLHSIDNKNNKTQNIVNRLGSNLNKKLQAGARANARHS